MTNTKKRVKSGAITFVSLFAAVATTPAWATFVHWGEERAVMIGIPIAVIGLVTVIIDNVWKQMLNNHTMKKAGMSMRVGSDCIESQLY